MEVNILSSKHLFAERPLVVDTTLARILGLNEAIVLQQVNYWIEINKKKNLNFYDDKYWTYNSIKDWREKIFEFWSLDTVRRAFASLEKSGILITGNYNKQKRDKTKWYSIDFSKLDEIVDGKEGGMHKCISAKCHNGLVQNAPMQECKMPKPLPETSTETNSETNINNIYSPNSTEFRLASYLFKYIKRNNDKAKNPNMQSWSKQFYYILQVDKRDVEDVKRVIQWCQDDSFWYKNILSPDKVRKQYDRLYLQMKDKEGKHGSTGQNNEPNEESPYDFSQYGG